MTGQNKGIENSKFYHALIRECRTKQTIQVTTNNDDTTTSATEIGAMAVDFFSKLYTAFPYHLDTNLFADIHPGISELDDQGFCSAPSIEEVWEAIKRMNPSSSPGKDGFTGYFYRSRWAIIKEDVFAFVIDFFKGAYIPRNISITTLVLIPKTSTLRQLGDYRPISLVNFCGKLISKILASRLAHLLPKLVDEEQTGFVHGRNIS